MRSIGISSASAAICANTVSTPCPTADEPMNTVMVPSSLTSSRALSFGPAAPPSTKLQIASPWYWPSISLPASFDFSAQLNSFSARSNVSR